MQQSGPSGTTQITRDSDVNQVLLQKLESLAAEVALLRGNGQGVARSRSSTESGLSSLFVPGASYERSEAASRSLNAVNSVALPEGGVWKGSQDTRSILRFLDSVSQRVQASGLGAHGAFFYLINECVSTGLAEEVIAHCPATKLSPVEYADACREASSYLIKAFGVTNLPSRFIEKVESLNWAKDCGSFDEYRQSFHRMIHEAQLLDVQMPEDNQRRLFTKGLPEKMRVMLEDRLFQEPVQKIIEYFDMWLTARNENPFARKAVKAVAFDLPEEAGDRARRPGGPKCFRCGEVGHIKAQCRKQFPGRQQDNKVAVVEVEANSAGAQVSDIPWNMASLKLAGATVDRYSPRMEVAISDCRGEGKTVRQVGLFDTGAQVTCCSRVFADSLYRAGIVKAEDIKHGYHAMLTLADEKTHLKPLGTVRVLLEGENVEVVVMPGNMCADLIVGFDLLTRSEKLLGMLVKDISIRQVRSKPPEVNNDSRQVVAVDCISGPVAIKDNERECVAMVAKMEDSDTVSEVVDVSHCAWPPVQLAWVEGAREKLQPNARQARGEARQLEARMARRSPGLLKAYNEVLQTWIGNGWLEEVREDEVKFCLRHFGVEKDKDGPTAMSRCRVVLDGKSLTPALRSKECSHTDIVRNLIVWRSASIFTVLDISQAYMRIKLSDKDSYYLCIYWGNRFYRFRSIPMGISPSAQILQEIVDHYVSEYQNRQTMGGLNVGVIPYMDDLIHVCWSNKTLEKDEKQATVFAMENALKSFLTEKRMLVSEKKTLRPDSTNGTLLGVKFSEERIAASSKLVSRQFARGELIVMKTKMTRRTALGFLCSLYDPLGLIVEVLMRARILASQLGGLAWDVPLPMNLATDVCRWIELCQTCLECKFPRKLSLNELFIFTDASAWGIAAIAYAKDDEGNWCRLIGRAKCYKKHQKAWAGTSSKVELLGLHYGVELAQYIREVSKELPEGFGIGTMVFGTDSEVNINRFGSRKFSSIEDRWERRNAEYVNNALCNLGASVFHIPGGINPADGPSRGIWKESFDVESSISWYKKERAVNPTKYVSYDEASETIQEVPVEPLVSLKAVANNASVSPSLEDRYVQESGDVSRVDWLRSWQESDSNHRKLVEKGTIELRDNVWTLKFRQELEGRWSSPVFVPSELVPNALVSAHDDAGHFGFSKTLAKARNVFFWPRMAADVRRHCLRCFICQQLKGNREWNTPPQSLTVDPTPWLVVGIDITKGFDVNGHHVVLTVTCLFTRYVFAFLLSRETSALIVKALRDCFWLEGPPRLVVTDNGAPFCSQEFETFLREMRVQHKLIPRHAPWYGGFYEVSHKCLTRTLSAMMLQRSVKDWKIVLSMATFLYNCRPYETLVEGHLSPQEVFRGRKAVSIWSGSDQDVDDCLRVSDITSADVEEVITRRNELIVQFEETWKQMRTHSAKEIARRMKGEVDYRVGDYVYVYVPRMQRSKVDVKWSGPFRITDKLTPTTWIVNGKSEHGYNLKLARGIDSDLSDDVGEHNVDAPRQIVRKRRNREDVYPEDVQVQGKKSRLRSLLACMPRGELLWV